MHPSFCCGGDGKLQLRTCSYGVLVFVSSNSIDRAARAGKLFYLVVAKQRNVERFQISALRVPRRRLSKGM